MCLAWVFWASYSSDFWHTFETGWSKIHLKDVWAHVILWSQLVICSSGLSPRSWIMVPSLTTSHAGSACSLVAQNAFLRICDFSLNWTTLLVSPWLLEAGPSCSSASALLQIFRSYWCPWFSHHGCPSSLKNHAGNDEILIKLKHFQISWGYLD